MGIHTRVYDDGTKDCSVCQERKPLTDFYKSDRYKSGYKAACRKCSYRPDQQRDPEKTAEYQARYHESMRVAIYTHYGEVCVCCGITDRRFLTLDHVDNDGASHRKEIGAKTYDLMRWIIKSNFPTSIQVLCYNCNMGKQRNHGVCPHKARSVPA